MKYNQLTGELTTNSGVVIGKGYAGHGEGKNNPAMESVKMVGPLPKGFYVIGKPTDNPHTGPYSIPLYPKMGNNMFGRSAFMIHGDSISNPGTASNGCIILPRAIRVQINNCVDKILEVV
jgi:hypothetical protein